MVDVQVRLWHDWPARFSCNARGEVWPTPALGYSRASDRQPLAGTFRTLDHTVEVVLDIRPLGGRFFVCEHGVWTFHEGLERKVQVVRFNLSSPPPFPSRCPGHT
jgi:hypothetical protein